MNKKEFAVLTDTIKSCYPRNELFSTPQAADVWFRFLKDIPFAPAMKGLEEYIKTNKFAPTIADIRASVYESNVDDKGWSKGWEEAMSAVKKFGYVNEHEALESLRGITKEAVRRFGYKDLCLTEQKNLSTAKAQFRMIYEQIASQSKAVVIKSDYMLGEVNTEWLKGEIIKLQENK